MPLGGEARRLLRLTSGRQEPRKGEPPAVMDETAASSKVVRLASGEQALPKLPPLPLPELRSMLVLSGAIREMLRSESRVWVSHNETATLVSGPVNPVTMLVD